MKNLIRVLASFLVSFLLLYFFFRQGGGEQFFSSLPLKQFILACTVTFFSFLILCVHYFEEKNPRENWTRFAILISLVLAFVFLYFLGLSIYKLKAFFPTDWIAKQSCENSDLSSEKSCLPLLREETKYSIMAMGIGVSLFLNYLFYTLRVKWLRGNLGRRGSLFFDFLAWFSALELFVFGYRSEALLIFINSFFISGTIFFLITTHLLPNPEKLEKPPKDAEVPKPDFNNPKPDPQKK